MNLLNRGIAHRGFLALGLDDNATGPSVQNQVGALVARPCGHLCRVAAASKDFATDPLELPAAHSINRLHLDTVEPTAAYVPASDSETRPREAETNRGASCDNNWKAQPLPMLANDCRREHKSEKQENRPSELTDAAV